MYESFDLVMITKDEYAKMIRMEERIEVVKELLDAGEYISEARLRTLLGIPVPAEETAE